jgi:hypothetical protein
LIIDGTPRLKGLQKSGHMSCPKAQRLEVRSISLIGIGTIIYTLRSVRALPATSIIIKGSK